MKLYIVSKYGPNLLGVGCMQTNRTRLTSNDAHPTPKRYGPMIKNTS